MTESNHVSETNSQALSGSNTSQAVSQNTEKLLPQSEVNDLVGRVKHDSYEKGRQAAFAEYKQQATAAPQQPVTPQMQQTIGGIPQLNQADIEKLVSDKAAEIARQELWQQAHNQRVNLMAADYNKSFEEAKSRYTDFDQVIKREELGQMGDLLVLMHPFENRADILYDLKNNPSKLANVYSNINAAKINNAPFFEDLARNQLREISNSIKANQTALAKEPHIREPLSQIQPSNVGADNGSNSIRDLRNQDWLRG